MKMKQLGVFALACAASVSAWAQTTPKPPSATQIATRHVKTLTTLLSLTSTQKQQATTIYTNAAKSEQTVIETQKAIHDNLRAAIKNNDTAGIDQVSNSVAQSTAELTSIRAKADAAFYQILTAEQQAKLSELESEHMGPWDGPGGPGGPPAMGFR
jgi:Spy/CpxP family protein refolding chaperone